jgi:hypothetical protein
MDTPPPLPRSAFVTAVAWVFIVLAGFGVFIGIVQNIMVWALFPIDQMHSALVQARQQQNIPAASLFIFEHIRELVGALIAAILGTLIISIGLLKRQNWARIFFISLLGLGIAWNILSVVWQWFFFRSMPQPPQGTAMQPQFQMMTIVMVIFSAVLAVGLSLLFGWIIKRLASPEIRNEFAARSTA